MKGDLLCCLGRAVGLAGDLVNDMTITININISIKYSDTLEDGGLCRPRGDLHMLKRKLEDEACRRASEKLWMRHVPADHPNLFTPA